MVSQSDYERDYERIVGSNGDPYAILGVARGCSAAEATKAYRRLALVFHVRRRDMSRTDGAA